MFHHIHNYIHCILVKMNVNDFENYNEFMEKLKSAYEQSSKKLLGECSECFVRLLEYLSNLKSLNKLIYLLEKWENYINECGVYFNDDLSDFMRNLYTKMSKRIYIQEVTSLEPYLIEFTLVSWFMQFSKEAGYIITNFIEIYNIILQNTVINENYLLEEIYFFNLGIQMMSNIKKNNPILISFHKKLTLFVSNYFSIIKIEQIKTISIHDREDMKKEIMNYLESIIVISDKKSHSDVINKLSINKDLLILYYYLKTTDFIMKIYIDDINFNIMFSDCLFTIQNFKNLFENHVIINNLIQQILNCLNITISKCLKAKSIPINLIKNTLRHIPSLEPNLSNETNKLEDVNKSMMRKMKKSEKQVIRQIKKKTLAISEEKVEKEKNVREKRKAEQKFLNQFAEQARNEHQQLVTSQNKKRHKLKKHKR